MRVLVTGGTGYLGSAIVRELARRGHQPVVFARAASSAGLPGAAFDGDIRDKAGLSLAAREVDAIVHCAALVTLWRRRAMDFDDVNIGGLQNVIDVARSAGTRRIVYTSTFLALPPNGATAPITGNDYQRTKCIARNVALRAAAGGAPIVLLSPGVVYGPGVRTEGNLVSRMLSDHHAGRLPGIIGADRIWSFAYVDDVAAAHVEAIERPDAAGEYPAGGDNVPQIRLFEVAAALARWPLPRRIPLPVARVTGLVEELRARITGHAPVLTRRTVDIFAHNWAMDSSRTAIELNYRITKLQDGVKKTLGALC